VKGKELDSERHIVRYVNSTSIESDGSTVMGAAFELRPGEDDLSVNWLEICGQDRVGRLKEVRRTCRMGRRSTLSRRKRDRFAQINVGELMRAVSGKLGGSRVVHDPQDATEEHCADPSHALVIGLPPHGADEAQVIGEWIAERVSATYRVIETQGD